MELLKKFLLFLVLYIIVPILILCFIEFFLRYKGYGDNLSPWLEHTTSNGKVYTKNLAFYQQFFDSPIHPGEIEPHITTITLPKPPNTIRIFVFGESAALGWPDARYSFGKFLEAMLNSMYPQYKWEVFNICFAGINSHVLRYVAKKSIFLEPDVVIIYMGNNEVHGTFGLYHLFRDSSPLPDYLVQFQLNLQNLYIFQNIRKLASKLGSVLPQRMSEIRYDDPRIARIVHNYENNLRAMVTTFIEKDIPVFIGTLGSNLRDWIPRESWFKKSISEQELEDWKTLFDEGLHLFSNKELDKAKRFFNEALKIDDSPAILHFLLGWCYIDEGAYIDAKWHFVQARERDGFGFVRAKNFINSACEKIVEEYKYTGKVFLVPVESELSVRSFANAPGLELFVDSCHFNFYGAYITACAYLKFLQNIFLQNRVGFNFEIGKLPPSFEDMKKLLFFLKDDYIFAILSQPLALHLATIYFPGNSVPIDVRDDIENLSERFVKRGRVKNYVSYSELEELFVCFDTFDFPPKDLLFRYLELLRDLGAIRQSLKILDKFGGKDVNDINSICLLLDIYLALNSHQHTHRIEDLLRRLEDDYSDWGDLYHYYLLKYLLLRNDWKEARNRVEKIFNLSFVHPSRRVFAECVQIYLNPQLNDEEKFNRWREVLEKCSWSWDGFNFIWTFAKKDGKKNAVKELFEKLVNKDLGSPFPYLYLAFLYEDEGDYSNSVNILKKAVAMNPSSFSLKYELARLLTKEGIKLLKEGLVEKSLSFFEEAVRAFPYYLTSWIKLVEACELLGDDEGLWRTLGEMEEIQKKNITSHLWEIIY